MAFCEGGPSRCAPGATGVMTSRKNLPIEAGAAMTKLAGSLD